MDVISCKHFVVDPRIVLDVHDSALHAPGCSGIWTTDRSTELRRFLRVGGGGLGTLVLHFCPDHETADVWFSANEKVVSIGSNISSYRHSFESINIELPLKTLVTSLVKVFLHD